MGQIADVVRCAACGREQPVVRRFGGRIAPVNPDTGEQWWSRAALDDGRDDAPMAGERRRIVWACSRGCREKIGMEASE